MQVLNGVFCATLTPFVSASGPVDYEWIPAHLRFLESHGIDGVLALGTTGEGPSLGLNERRQVLDIVLRHRGNLAVIASTGCAALTETISLSRYALDEGADAILVMPPFYFKGASDRGILDYYRALCDALPHDARLFLYHIPQVTAVPITPMVISGLLVSHGDMLYGIKDSSGDMLHTAGMVREFPEVRIFSGSDSHAAHALADGVAGIISALANVWPDYVHAVYAAYQNGGDVASAQECLNAARALIVNPAPAPLKAALGWRSGLPRTSVRLPLVNLSDQETAALHATLQSAGVIA